MSWVPGRQGKRAGIDEENERDRKDNESDAKTPANRGAIREWGWCWRVHRRCSCGGEEVLPIRGERERLFKKPVAWE